MLIFVRLQNCVISPMDRWFPVQNRQIPDLEFVPAHKVSSQLIVGSGKFRYPFGMIENPRQNVTE